MSCHLNWTLGLAALFAASGVACAPPNDACEEAIAGTVCLVAGTGMLGFNGDGHAADETDFFLPTRARRGPDGLLYISDFNNWRMRRVGLDGVVETVAGNGFHAPAIPGAPALDSTLENPTDFDFLPDGRLILVSFEDPRVVALDANGIVRVLAGTGEVGVIGNEGDGSPALQASFMELQGIAVASDGTIFVSDSGAHRVRVIRDGIVRTLAGTGTAGYSGDGGAGALAELNYPTALTVDERGTLYVADTLNHVIRKISPDGQIETVAGRGESGFAGDGGAARDARLNEPNGLALAPDGSLLIADRSNFRVRRVSWASSAVGVIETLCGSTEGHGGDGGPGIEAQFGYLARLSMDGSSLLVADQSNGTLRRVHLSD